MKTAHIESIKDGLVAILKDKSDLAILQEQGWYRIPVASAPKRWPPRWLAFYQPRNFGGDAYRIRYFGQVNDIRRAKRREIFPNEIASAKSEREYFILNLAKLEEREVPIPSYRPRRLVFIPTTWAKFEQAEQINDLFDDSPLEDKMWLEMKRLALEAERQWAVSLPQAAYYFLDFALFCKNGRIDVETDGDSWHLGRERAPLDNARDNALQIDGWTVLRYNTHQIRENFQAECLRGIEAGINKLGGLSSDGLVPRVFYTRGSGSVQQLNLFDGGDGGYSAEAPNEPDDLD
jgi:very-short-patch-repair endonuclease